MPKSAEHFNGNLLCAVDIETTGLQPGRHDIREMAILPLTPDLKYDKDFGYFYAKFRPYHENFDSAAVSKEQIEDMYTNGQDRDTIEIRLREWFSKLGLRSNKKIVPLGSNYSNFDRPFLMDWLGGPASYEEFFDSRSRDIMFMTLMINDMCDYHSEKIPFPKNNLQYVANCVNYKPEEQHTAIGDCLTSIEVYRRLMRYHNYWDPMRIGAVSPVISKSYKPED